MATAYRTGHFNEFLSTPSARRATQRFRRWLSLLRHFYPRPPRGGRRGKTAEGNRRDQISIHALREEGDPSAKQSNSKAKAFLSTPSARRATSGSRRHFRCGPISIHALREEGDMRAVDGIKNLVDFYPRPPRGGRHTTKANESEVVQFLSTPSARRATLPEATVSSHQLISIHALREEGDRSPP